MYVSQFCSLACARSNLARVLWFSALIVVDCCAADRVFRCVDAQGRIEFTQTGCLAGSGESLLLDVPEIGWKKPKKTVQSRQDGEEQASESQGRGRRARVTRGAGKKCWRVQNRLQQVRRQIRKGYKPAAGERLHRQRDELESYVRGFCS